MSLRSSPSYWSRRGSVIEAQPEAEPVTAAQLQDFLRTDSTDLPDADANTFIKEARQEIEQASGLALITQSWRLSLDNWPVGRSSEWWDGERTGAVPFLNGSQSSAIRLPVFPLQSVTSVTTYDQSDTSTAVVVADVFDVDAYRHEGRLALKSGASWPSATRPTNAIQIIYVAGYGDSAADVPPALIRAVKQLAAYFYNNRGDGCAAEDAYKASGAASIVGRFTVKDI